MVNFYELLGVKKTATKDEISKAYRSMMKKYHPDINKSADAVKMSTALNEAKEILLNDLKRREYDLELENIKQAKQYSYNKQETYKEKTREHQEHYSEVYLTRWQIFRDYLKRSIDKTHIKIIKSILVTINYLVFQVFKFLILAFLYLVYVSENVIGIIIGLLAVFGILAIFLVKPESGPNYLPWIPGNIELFILFELISFLLTMLYKYLKNNTGNFYAFIQDIHDKIFIKILRK